MLDITKFHGQNAPKEELEEVVILPIGEYEDGDIVTLPSGYTWSDFEYLETALTVEGSPENTYGPGRFLKEDILNSPTSWSFRVSWTNNTAFLAVRLDYLSDTTATVVAQGPIATQRLKYLYGYKKRYATKNLSRTISVNGGNNIAVNSRYEVDLPSEFYEPDGSIKKGVQVRAEIYNDGAVNGEAGWGPCDIVYNGSNNDSYGVQASILEDKVVVQTGATYITYISTRNGNPFNFTASGLFTSEPCRVIATLNDAYVLSVEPAQGSFERIVNAGLDVLEFTNNGDYAYVPLSDTDFDGDIFEYNSTTRFLRPKRSGKHIPSVFSHAEDGAGQARVKYVLVQADTAQGDNPVVATGVFTKQYTSDGGTQSIHTPVNLDESKWYALYAENFTSGNVTYTSLVSPTSEPDLGDITDYAFIFSLERG